MNTTIYNEGKLTLTFPSIGIVDFGGPVINLIDANRATVNGKGPVLFSAPAGTWRPNSMFQG